MNSPILLDIDGKALNEMWGPTMILRWSKETEGERILMQLWQSNQGKFIWKPVPTEDEFSPKLENIV